MQEQEQNNITQAEKVEPIAIYQNNIYALVDDVKMLPQYQNKSDEELKQDKSFFPVMIDYIYNNYICELLDNRKGTNNRYHNIDTIDYLFNIYTDLVYKYKWNNKPFIVEFSTFTGINKDTIYTWLNGEYKSNLATDASGEEITRHASDLVQKWVNVCERELLNGSDTIKDIFILKAKHGYRDNNNVIEVNHNVKQIISADSLPALIGLNSNN